MHVQTTYQDMKDGIERSVVLVVPLVRMVAGQESKRRSIGDYGENDKKLS
jgi:hypothetical protein